MSNQQIREEHLMLKQRINKQIFCPQPKRYGSFSYH